ncbi:MAG: SUF system Fe-S cluster assembly regulator [Methylococcales bacterium]
MLRISKLTDYSTVILGEMARSTALTFTTAELAASTGIAQPTVSKVLKLLGKSSLVLSIRGTNGGYQLASKPEQISVAQIISAMEGPIGITECCTTSETCNHASHCHISGHWGVINRAIETTLQTITLADLVSPVSALVEMTVSVDSSAMVQSNR